MSKFDSKIFNPQAFGKYVDIIPKVRKNELIKSKALQPNSQIKTAFSSQTGVVYATIPMYGRLGGEPLNYDGQTDITATSTTTYDRGVVVIGRAKSWVEKDFSEDITGGAENLEFISKHTYDISSESVNVVGASSLNSAIQKASGDKKSKFSVVVMHSSIATNLENLKLIAYMKHTDAQGVERQLDLATWNGRIVLIDDGMPTVDVAESEPGAGNSYTKYTTYVLGNGAFDFEDIGAEVPYAMVRDEKTDGGQTYLYSRQRKVFAPYGISFTKTSMASNSPTYAELATGDNWTLVNDGNGKYINHKSIPIARIISRG